MPTTPRPRTLFFSVGEPSGDVHGANLIRELKDREPTLRAVGYGGPKMQEAGCELHADLTALAVMWFLRALLNLHKFWWLYRRARRYFRQHRPDAVVLVDFPGFNWWIARAARRHGIPVFYYVPPQVWAWARWRVKKMRRLVDHVLCCLPFEQQWYAEHGCNAVLVGHPFFDEVTRRKLDRPFVERLRGGGPLVTVLPGSRTQELTHNLHWLLKAAGRVRAAVPDVRFAVAAFKAEHAEMARRGLAAEGLEAEVHVGRTPELIAAADCCMSVSGSVSLELLYHTKPTVVLYWINRFAYRAQRYLRKVKYITLVNLLSRDDRFCNDESGSGVRSSFFAARNSNDSQTLRPRKTKSEHPTPAYPPDAEQVLFPEYLTCEDKSAQVAGHVIDWLTDAARREERVAQLAELKARVCHPGSAANAAEYVLRELADGGDSVPRPHYLRGVKRVA